MGKNRAPRSFADEYGLKLTANKRVEKPGSVKSAVFLSFAQLAIGMVFMWTDPNFRGALASMGDPSTAMLIQSVGCFIMFLFILGLNAGMNWIRWLYLIFTPIGFVFFVIGLLITFPMIPPVWQIGSALISTIVFFNLASDSAGRWYRAIANGQNR